MPKAIELMKRREEEKSRVIGISFTFSDYLQRLEKAGVIEYKEGKWRTTPQALEVLAKYFG